MEKTAEAIEQPKDPDPQKTIKELQKKISALTHDLQVANNKAENLKSTADNAIIAEEHVKQTLKTLHKQMDSLKQTHSEELKTLQTQLTELKEANTKLIQENNDLKEQQKALIEEANTWHMQAEDYRSQMEEAQQEIEKVEELERKNQELKVREKQYIGLINKLNEQLKLSAKKQ